MGFSILYSILWSTPDLRSKSGDLYTAFKSMQINTVNTIQDQTLGTSIAYRLFISRWRLYNTIRFCVNSKIFSIRRSKIHRFNVTIAVNSTKLCAGESLYTYDIIFIYSRYNNIACCILKSKICFFFFLISSLILYIAFPVKNIYTGVQCSATD